ncbi:MAG: GNAT family N-acetyltransferase [Betaproteobacteria bacterium]|jgi:putative hemolysin|nr:GNAT family N-acetyltransferase [Betaproteobacteria bacterium]
MLNLRQQADVGSQPSLTVSFAQHQSEVREAQRLRYRVFAEEMGARLEGSEPGVDEDRFDEHCQHLLVRDDNTGEVVGTYRVITPDVAKRVGGFYSESEFDISRLDNLRDRLVEVGRSCVHPDYRHGGTIAMLWGGLARFAANNGYDYAMGCASISMADGGHVAASIYRTLREKHLSPLEYRVFPRFGLPMEHLDWNLEAEIPPLLKGYIRLGAYICGEPAWDPDFNTADVLVLMPMARMSQRYARRLLSNA